jgi:hypothetical protein
MTTVLMLGSAPMVTKARDWPRAPFDRIVAINNAWRAHAGWTDMIHPWDFRADLRPVPGPDQRIITETEFVPAQNAYGGFVYAGATMAYTAAYWALDAFRPDLIAVFGCDMMYPAKGPTHFYGTGSPDPLRADITLQSLEAKSARLMVLAAMQGCAMVNLSTGPSRLVFPRATRAGLRAHRPLPFSRPHAERALDREAALGYVVPSGRYWVELDRFDPAELRALDRMWLDAAASGLAATG